MLNFIFFVVFYQFKLLMLSICTTIQGDTSPIRICLFQIAYVSTVKFRTLVRRLVRADGNPPKGQKRPQSQGMLLFIRRKRGKHSVNNKVNRCTNCLSNIIIKKTRRELLIFGKIAHDL